MMIIRVFQRHFSSTRSLREDMISDWDKKKLFFGRIKLYNKRHLPEHKKKLFKPFQAKPDYDHPVHNYGCRGTGIRHEAGWEAVPEMIPSLVVPDLTDFKLKPYVSYRTEPIVQEEMTSKDLFNAVYGNKIVKDFKENKLNENGEPREPSPEESLTPEMAYIKARQSGSDIYQGGVEQDPKFKLKYKR